MMLGGLHIEMATLTVWVLNLVLVDTKYLKWYSEVLGDWLEDGGWTSALVQANIASTGTADSFIKASHVAKMHIKLPLQVSTLCCTKHTVSTHLKQLQQGQEFFRWKCGVKCILRRVSISAKQCY